MVRVRIPPAKKCPICNGKLLLLDLAQNQWKCTKCGRKLTLPRQNIQPSFSHMRCPFCGGSVRLIDASRNLWKCEKCGSEMTKPLSPSQDNKTTQIPPRWFLQKYGRY